MKNSLAGYGAVRTQRAPVGKLGAAIATAVIGASTLVASPAFAQSTTMKLIDMMHANGSITDTQYNQLKAAAAQEAQQAPQQQSNSQLRQTNAGTDTSVPTTLDNDTFRQKVEKQFDDLAWLNRIKLTGDVRLRYEYTDNVNALDSALAGGNQPDQDRSRGRFRYRLGIIANPIDNLEVGGGLASGGNDPRSTNQTFGDDFSSKGIQLDYAYAQYDFSPYLADGFKLSAIGGKFKMGKYLWAPTDAMWDGDINPEGFSVHAAKDSSLGETYVNSGVWVIDERGSSDQDPYLWYVQGGQDINVNNFFASLAGTYYGFEETYTGVGVAPDTVFQYGSGTNTTSQFSVVDVSGAIGTKFDGGKAQLVGQYIKNTHSDVNNDMGWAAGAKVAFDQWDMKYLYVDLDRNAVPDSYPDSDRFNGATGIKGHEVALAYNLNKAIELGVDYYNAQSKFANERQNLVQTDVVFSF